MAPRPCPRRLGPRRKPLRLPGRPPRPPGTPVLNTPAATIAITGGSGLVGAALRHRLQATGRGVVLLVRREPHHPQERRWGTDGCELTGVDAVVHLAGESIASGLWTAERKRRILESRSVGTAAIARDCREQGIRLICASAVGLYGNRGEEELDESFPAGMGFLAEVCKAWEEAAGQAGPASVQLRFGQILSWNGGALALQARLYRSFLGARLGDGSQWMPWISLEDAVAAILHVLESDLSGAINVVSPTPARQAEFHALMCRRIRRPSFPSAPAVLLDLLPGGFGRELLLASTKVHPQRLRSTGFAWKHPDLETFLK